MVGVVLFVYLIDSVAFYPFLMFFVIEVMTLIVSIVHARRPHLGVVLIYVSLEIGKALAAMTLALVTVLNDHDKDCAVKRVYPTFIFLSGPIHRHSPQLHDYNSDDDTMPLNF
ncbi:hypothetical protein OSTOST_03391 [Ostertagia ostertagi]